MLKPIGLMSLSDGIDLHVVVHPLFFYIRKIMKGNLYFSKLNHSFFEFLIYDYMYENKIKDNKIEYIEMKKNIDAWTSVHDRDIIFEVVDIIRSINNTDIILGVNNVKHVSNLKLSNNKNNRYIEKLSAIKILSLIPSGYIPHSSSLWKYECIKNGLEKFIDEVNNHEVIIVGMSHLVELSKKFKNMKHYEINFSSNKKNNRKKVLNDLYEISCNNSNKKVILFQAGEVFSLWLIYNLSHVLRVKNCSLIDMGRSLDFYCPNREFKKENIIEGVSCDFKCQKWMNKDSLN